MFYGTMGMGRCSSYLPTPCSGTGGGKRETNNHLACPLLPSHPRMSTGMRNACGSPRSCLPGSADSTDRPNRTISASKLLHAGSVGGFQARAARSRSEKDFAVRWQAGRRASASGRRRRQTEGTHAHEWRGVQQAPKIIKPDKDVVDGHRRHSLRIRAALHLHAPRSSIDL